MVAADCCTSADDVLAPCFDSAAVDALRASLELELELELEVVEGADDELDGASDEPDDEAGVELALAADDSDPDEPLPDASLPEPQGIAGVAGVGWLSCSGVTVWPLASAMAKRVVHCGLEPLAVVAW